MWIIVNTLQITFVVLWTVFCITFIMWYLPIKIIFFLGRSIWGNLIISILGGRLKTTGIENIPRGQNYMFLGNHSSWLDIILLVVTAKRPIRFIAKKELRKIPFLGFIMYRLGMIFVDRGNPTKSALSVKQTLEKLKSGSNIVGFPEGTRTRTGQMGSFKKGLFSVAVKAGVDIVPVGIVGAQKVWSLNNFKFRPGNLEVNFGNPIPVSEYNEQNIQELVNKVREEVARLSKQTKE